MYIYRKFFSELKIGKNFWYNGVKWKKISSGHARYSYGYPLPSNSIMKFAENVVVIESYY